MADAKISELADGGSPQATDELAVNRGGASAKVAFGHTHPISEVTGANIDSIQLLIGNGVDVLSDADEATVFVVPWDCEVMGWTMLADQAGTVTIDVQRTSYTDFPANFASIAGTEKPSLTAVQKNRDTSITTWSTPLAKGDIIKALVQGTPTPDAVTLVTLYLDIEKADA
jgi:hypothetical protein